MHGALVKQIALLVPGLDQIGGAERQVISLAQGLAARAWNVSMIALSGSGEAVQPQLAHAGVRLFGFQMRHGLADPPAWLRVNRWLRTHRPDIVHAHLPHATYLARWARLTSPVRVVIDTIHTSATGPIARRLGFASSRWLSDCTTIVSHTAAQGWQDAGTVSASRLAVIPNGVDTEVWRPDTEMRAWMRAQLGIGNTFMWLAAGRLDPVKNYALLLRAFARLPAGTLLYVAGTGPLEAELRQQACDLGIQDRVHFLGFVDNLLPWMQAADAVALASRWEGLPLVLLEAAATALPVVATDVPGTREVIVPGSTGFLCAADDPAQMAAAMLCVMDLSPEQRAATGANARAHTVSNFSLPRVLDRWEALYEHLLAIRRESRRFALRNPRRGSAAEGPYVEVRPAPEASPIDSADAR